MSEIRVNIRGKRGKKSNPFYEKYWSKEDMENKPNYVGKLKVFPMRRKVGYVDVEGANVDIFIADDKGKNRSMMGDTVAVEILPQDQWADLPQKESNKTDDPANAAPSVFNIDQLQQNADIQQRLWCPSDDVISANCRNGAERRSSAEGTPHPLDVLAASAEGKQPTGRVVAIVERGAKKTGLVGRLEPVCEVWSTSGALPDDQTYVYFNPSDPRLPNGVVPRLQLPDAFVDMPCQSMNHIYTLDFQSEWPETSKMPICCNVRSIGEAGNIAAETEALLTANGCHHLGFSDDCMANLQGFMDQMDAPIIEAVAELSGRSSWQIPDEELARRKDFRDYRICTIDPPTAKDLDDALHIRPVEGQEDVYEVGVHIADVSYFLKPDTSLDQEAKNRATSVYLVQKVIPMLPPLLCEQLCSLNPNVDRLAFSCVWKMRADGTLVEGEKPWFGRSVIRSCAKLDYPTAQRMVDGDIPYTPDANPDTPDAFLSNLPEEVWETSRRPVGQAAWALSADVRALHRCAMGRRQKRLASGALVLHRAKLTFTRDAEGNPVEVGTYKIRESNQLVEEYMLLANYLVAQALLASVGPAAFIRNHPPPRGKGMEELTALAEHLGMPIDVSSAASLQESLNRISRNEDPRCMRAVSALLMAPMNVASYAAAGTLEMQAWRHYALSIPYYTHFTSPIRRYADVMVHRLLDVVVRDDPDEIESQKRDENVSRLQTIAERCNEMKAASKAAQERSDVVFFAIYIKSHPHSTPATVIGIGEKSFTLLIDAYGFEKRIFVDEMAHVKPSLDDDRKELTIFKHRDATRRRPKFDLAQRLAVDQLKLSLMASVKVFLAFKAEAPIDVYVLIEGPC